MAVVAPGQEGRCCPPPKGSGVRRGQLHAGPRIVFPKRDEPCVTSQIPSRHLRAQKQGDPKTPYISFSPLVGDRLSLIKDQ